MYRALWIVALGSTSLLSACRSEQVGALEKFERSFSTQNATDGAEAYYQLKGRFPSTLGEINKLKLGIPDLPANYKLNVTIGTDEYCPTYSRRVIVAITDPHRNTTIRNHVYMGVGEIGRDWISVSSILRKSNHDLFLASTIALEMWFHRGHNNVWADPQALLKKTEYDFEFEAADLKGVRLGECMVNRERWKMIGIGKKKFLFPMTGPRDRDSLRVIEEG